MKVLIIIITLFTLSSTLVYSQQHADSLKKVQQHYPEQARQKMGSYYKRALNIDSTKAEQVAQIMAAYKTGMYALSTEQTLTNEARRAKIKALIEEKNRKLSAILGPAQQSRIIPGTERDPAKQIKRIGPANTDTINRSPKP